MAMTRDELRAAVTGALAVAPMPRNPSHPDDYLPIANTIIAIVGEACAERLETKTKLLPHDYGWQRGMNDACIIIRALTSEKLNAG